LCQAERKPFAHDAAQARQGGRGRGRVHFKAPWRSGAAHADINTAVIRSAVGGDAGRKRKEPAGRCD